jgi:alpha-acetolactate decarboxylase
MKIVLGLIFSVGLVSCASHSHKFEQYGTMHEAIGRQQHHARVNIEQLTQKKGFTGVGALEGLNGEVTILNGKAVITGVNAQGKPTPRPKDLRATLLVGTQVKSWKVLEIPNEMSRKDFETWLAGQTLTSPSMFKLQGKINNIRLHILNGACPVHARMNKLKLPAEKMPYEGNFKELSATLVGVYAKDAVGKLTHPDTSIHTHIVYKSKSGEDLTGHLEDFSLGQNTKVFLPRL